MPRTVEIPRVGEIEFPDSMSEAEVNKAAAKLYADSGKIGGDQQASPSAPVSAPAPGGGVPAPATSNAPSQTPSGGLGGVAQQTVESALQAPVGLAASYGRFAAHSFPYAAIPGATEKISKFATAAESAWNNWLDSYRTAKDTTKVPVLDMSVGEVAGSVMGGMLIPLPGGGASGATIGERAVHFLKSTLFGTAAFTAVDALPKYLEADDAGKKAIIDGLPENISKQLLIAAGLFGAHEFYGAGKKVVSKADAPFVAAVAEQDGKIPDTLVGRRPTEEEIKRGKENIEEVTKILGETEKAPSELRDETAQKIQKSQAVLDRLKSTGASADDISLAEKTVQYWKNKQPVPQTNKIKIAAKDLQWAADEGHTMRLIQKGEAEKAIATEGARDPSPKTEGMEPPKTSYQGDAPAPKTDFAARMKGLFDTLSMTPLPFREQWDMMWRRINKAHWDADTNRDHTIKTIPDEGMRNQATKFLIGMKADPAAPALDGPTSKFVERTRELMEKTMDAGRQSELFSKNRYLDVLSSMFKEKAAAREYFANHWKQLRSNGQYAKMPISDFWKHLQYGVNKRGLSLATNDLANFVNQFELRYATSNAIQSFKSAIQTIPGVAIPRKSVLSGIAPEGYTLSAHGHLNGYYVPKEVEKVISTLTDRSIWNENDILKFVKTSQDTLKRAAVAVSGFHHIAMFRTMLAAGYFNPRGALEGLEMLDHRNPVVGKLAEGGLQIWGARPDISERIKAEYEPEFGANKLAKLYSWWDAGLWEKHVPGAIAFTGFHYFNEMTRAHPNWPEARVVKQVVDKVNTAFGMNNTNEMARSATMRDNLRFLMFAPTWTETRLKMFYGAGKEVVDLLTGKGTLADTMFLRQTVGHTLVAGTIGELLNAGLRSVWGGKEEKETTRRFGEVALPFMKDKHGKPMMVDFLMYLREPYEMLKESVKLVGGYGHPFREASKYISGRRSQILSWAMEETSNADFKGSPIRRPEESVPQNVWATLGHTASHFLPIVMQHSAQGFDILHAHMEDFKTNAAKDMASVMGFRSRTDYPIELRVKIESQMANHPAVVSRVKTLRMAGRYDAAMELERSFNKKADDIAAEIKHEGFQETLGSFWSKNRRFAYIK